MYQSTHLSFSIVAAINNMTSNLIHTIARVAGSKGGSKPKPVTVEKMIGTFDEFMNGEKAQAEDTPDSIYSKMLMLFPEVKK